MDSNASSEQIQSVLSQFKSFLLSAWPSINELLTHHDWDNDPYFFDDWLDANWGLLVGRQLVGKQGDLQPLTASIRQILENSYDWRLEANAPVSKVFASMGSSEGGFSVKPPFDVIKVILPDGVSEVVPWGSLRFELVRSTMR